jgi:hypothetical protein
MIRKILNNKLQLTLAILLLVEILSFGAHYFSFSNVAFLIIFTLILIATLYKTEYGLLVAFIELIIDSMGYLFYFDFGGATFSIRMGVWLIILSVWPAKKIKETIGKKMQGHSFSKQFNELLFFIKNNYLAYFLILFLFIAWGAIRGYLNGQELGSLFLDANSYLYFALIFPTYSVINSYKKTNKDAGDDFSRALSAGSQILLGAVVWISLKSLFLLYIFSHNLYATMDVLYQWVRDTKVGEITEMSEGSYRIFFQSHVFVIIGFFVLLFFLNKLFFTSEKDFKSLIKEKKGLLTAVIFLLSLLFSVVIIGFSRSFWVGFAAGLIVCFFLIFKQYGWKRMFISAVAVLLSATISLGLISGIVNFPYPEPGGRFNVARSASDRAKQAKEGGAAVSSRWALLPKLWNDIKGDPVLGKGFGATITYTSSDPRVLERTADGKYTTFAFEWGWLDIWLKMGLLGLICYLAIMVKMLWDGYFLNSKNKWFVDGIIVGIIILAAINFFTPFLNHPLGIGYLIITAALLDKIKGDI